MDSIEKAVSGERARIEALLARESARVRRAFRAFLDSFRSDAVRRQVRLALEQGGVEAALGIIDAHIVRLSGALNAVFQNTAQAEIVSAARRFGLSRAGVAVTFDPAFPRAAALMRTNRLEFVREFTRQQRAATRAALAESFQSGTGVVQTARAFRDSIGLTETQLAAVSNYRRLLETRDAAALTRDLRDRRFDASVRRAIEADEPLGAKRIQRMTERYRERYLQYRAEAIASTETLRTVNMAQREGFTQVLEQADIPSSRVTRIWYVTRDGRQRTTHDAMGGQRRGMNEPFESPSGARLMYPGDSSAPAAEVIHCRCVVVNSIAASE